jgi:5-methylcytosine-specific restriction endonuclease McrA
MKTKLPPKVAKACYIRDGWKCRHCKNRNDLHPHHVTYRSQQGAHELNNLLTLCWKCHQAEHDGFLLITVVEVLLFDLKVTFKKLRGWKP